jgi:hypothetical protein
MTAGAAALNKSLQCSDWDPAMRPDLIKTYSPLLVDRYIKVCQAIATVTPLQDNWQAMFDGSRTAIVVVNDIEDWNSEASDARNSATQGQYSDALTKLRTAEASVSDATRIATNLSAIKDVSTLTTWLTRMTNVDDALGVLWQQMIDSKGVVNAQVAAALRTVNDANALLPQTTDAYASSLQVVMYEMAGDLVSEASAINQSNGALANAVADLTGGGTVYGR